MYPLNDPFAQAAQSADRQKQRELAKGIIVKENDYTSNLTSALRSFWDARGLRAYAHAQVLDESQERTFGCDAIIILGLGPYAKVGLFEAKYPRLMASSYRWDRLQLGTSHFSNQLVRQSRWTSDAAIWELILNEHPPGQPVHPFIVDASTCVWHEDAYNYDQGRSKSNPWSTGDLISLVGGPPRKGHQLSTMISKLADCRAGFPLEIRDGHVSVSEADTQVELRIPATFEALTGEAPHFCAEYGLSALAFAELQRIDE